MCVFVSSVSDSRLTILYVRVHVQQIGLQVQILMSVCKRHMLSSLACASASRFDPEHSLVQHAKYCVVTHFNNMILFGL